MVHQTAVPSDVLLKTMQAAREAARENDFLVWRAVAELWDIRPERGDFLILSRAWVEACFGTSSVIPNWVRLDAYLHAEHPYGYITKPKKATHG